MSKSKKDRETEMECMADTPNIRVLYDIVLEMNKQLQDFKKKVSKLEKEKQAVRKKMNIVEWLDNQHRQPDICWETLINNIKFDREILREIFKTTMSDEIFSILSKECAQHEIMPIRAYEQKPNLLYVFNYGKWNLINSAAFEKYAGLFHKKCMREFMNWQRDAEKTLSVCSFNTQFTENISKLNKKSISQLSKIILSKIHSNYKVNIKNIIQYDFD
tara:strand:- start:407 stop:1057 length:651 start_codon:yes stop_codon:yes gene_type:complete